MIGDNFSHDSIVLDPKYSGDEGAKESEKVRIRIHRYKSRCL